MDATLKKLIEGVIARDEEAYSMLYQMYYPKAYAQALRLCRNDADAKDMAQDAMIQVYRSLSQLKNIEYFDFWFYRIVANKCKKMFYRNRDALYDPEKLKRDALIEERIEYMPDKQLDNKIDKEIVHDLVFLLNENQREILDLFYFNQKSVQEISVILDIPEGTVKSRIFQARKHLKEKVDLYQKMQQRKLSFHLDFVMPSFFFLFITKLGSMKLFKSMKFVQATQVISVASVVVVGSMSVLETKKVVEDIQNSQTQPVLTYQKPAEKQYTPIEFEPIQYQDKNITTPKAAYFALKSVVPQVDDMEEITPQIWQELKPIVDALRSKQSRYLNDLTKEGWLTAFDAFQI